MQLQAVLDNQLTSIKNFNTASFSEDLAVHPVTSRFATLTASLLLLSSDFEVLLPSNPFSPLMAAAEARRVEDCKHNGAV